MQVKELQFLLIIKALCDNPSLHIGSFSCPPALPFSLLHQDFFAPLMAECSHSATCKVGM